MAMASLTGTGSAPLLLLKPLKATNGINSVSFSLFTQKRSTTFPSLSFSCAAVIISLSLFFLLPSFLPSFFHLLTQHNTYINIQAQKETVDKVCEIVRKQLALSDDTAVTGDSEFSKLGADSLDTVEIVMGLEEHFEISVDEGSAQDIKTVHDAAQMIEQLKAKSG
ncbi:Acyl carrier protein [Rhynchospora pubera]|uniref:Acyl carrier protein n=1 Tax=Rhynchospora pubera TaxID=906938 RepID=A0AAV8EC11_9POAL|nr:Acyl carrier protein [Rhynchospora pubera]